MTHATRFSWLLLCIATALPDIAQAHAERQSFFPDGRVSQRPTYRPLLPQPQETRLVVCKKPGDEGIGPGEDSATLIGAIADDALRNVNRRLLLECSFEHLQAAVDAVQSRGTTIYVLPGIYREQPSIRALDENAGATKPSDKTFCEAVIARGDGKLSYEEQVRCRHLQNTVAIFGDPNYTDDNCGSDYEGVCANPQTQACNPAQSICKYYDLQIEGTGAKNTDVIFEGDFITDPGDADADGQFRYLNGIRADRADGIYLRNFTAQIYEFNAVYLLETDGAVLDRLLARWVDEYAYLSFACDHVLYETLDGYGAADSVLYPGSGADIYKAATHADANLRVRQGTEIRNSTGRHAAGGYSGTAGNSPWVHNNKFFKNQTGLATESIFGGHPGMPQDHGLFENNLIYNNNKNYFAFVEDDGPCIAQTPRDRGIVPPEFRVFDTLPAEVQEAILDRMVLCPGIPFPTGAGMVIGGGNYNVNQNNRMWDNWRYGYMLFHVPTALRYGEEQPPDDYAVANPYDNSYFDRFLNNRFAENALFDPPLLQPNTNDFWFDNSGTGHCYDGNTSMAGAISADTGGVLPLPGGPCTDGPIPDAAGQTAAAQNDRIAFLASCIAYDRDDPATKSPECPFFDPLVAPAGRQGETTVIASQPPAVDLNLGETARTGYFVLNNDTGALQSVSGVTIDVGGPVEYLDELTLSVTVAHDGQVSTFSTTLTDPVAGDNVFTFDPVAPVPAVNYVLFDLSAKAGGTVAAKSGPAVMLASGGTGSLVLALLLAAPGRRRNTALLAAAVLVAAAALSSCGTSAPIGGGAVTFKVTAIDVTDANGVVGYAGMPKAIGRLSLH